MAAFVHFARRAPWLAITALAGCLALPQGALAGGTLHVDAASLEPVATCGSEAAPCATIDDALAHATGGEQILVAAGSYPGATIMVPVHLRGVHAGIDGASRGIGAPGSSTITGTIEVRAAASIDGFAFDGTPGPAIDFRDPAPGYGPGASVVTNATFTNAAGGAVIQAQTQLAGLTVSNSLFQGSAGDAVFVHGELDGGTPGVIVERNVFRDITGAAVDAGGTPNLRVRFNEVHDSGSLVVLSNTDAIAAPTVVNDNRGDGFTASAIYVGRGVRGASVERNVLRGGQGAFVRTGDDHGTGTTSDLTIRANDASGFGSGISLGGTTLTGGVAAHGNRLVDVQRSGAALENSTSGLLDARRNWWGTSAGLAAGAVRGTGIDASEPLRLVGVFAPAQLLVGGSGEVAVRLIGPVGGEPERDATGFAVTFSSSAATVDASSVTLRQGSASTLITAGTTPGTTTTTATLDGESVTATTTVLPAGSQVDDSIALPSVAESRPTVHLASYLVKTRVLPRTLRRSLTNGFKQRVSTNLQASVRTTYMISHYDARRLGLRPRSNRTHQPFILARVRTRAIRGTRIVTAPVNERPAYAIRHAKFRIAVNVLTVVRSRKGYVRRHYRRIVLPVGTR